MNRERLKKLFTDDTSYIYHVIKTEEPNGHLVYLMKSDSELKLDSLEFESTKIVEDVVKDCFVTLEKFAPSVFFTDDIDTDILKEKLNQKLSETKEFSDFIEYYKDEYRILEIKDSLLYKKDPAEYEAAKQKEHNEKQKELLDQLLKEIENNKNARNEKLLSYNNNLFKLLKEFFQSRIEYEKLDFDFTTQIEEFLSKFIDEETWIKVNNKPFICRTEIVSLFEETIDIFVTDNNDYSFTVTLRFDKTKFIAENILRINKGDNLPRFATDYEILIQLFDIDVNTIEYWDLKTESDKFEYIINYLVPIFNEESKLKEQKLLEKLIEEDDTIVDELSHDCDQHCKCDDDCDDCDDKCENK